MLARRILSFLTIALSACAGRQHPAAGATDKDGLLAVGTQLPDLKALDQDGAEHHLGEARGHFAVVYFYPKDATPGCTKEACAIRDVWSQFEAAGVRVYGVSGDDVASKASFAKEHRLTFPLLADTDRRWIDAFGVPTMLGMPNRVTFLLDREGRVAKVYRDVDPGVHAKQLLADVAALGAPAP